MNSTPARLAVFWHPEVLNHDTGMGFSEYPASPFLEVQELHPENADRVRNMHAILQQGPLNQYTNWHDGRFASTAEICAFHEPSYVESLEKIEEAVGKRLSGTTLIAPGTIAAAHAAAGTTLAALAHILGSAGEIAYALVRPPGHHATPAQVDGYCFFNNVSIAAEHARAGGKERIAIIDWDVHHGNGTQTGFYTRSDILTISLHMDHGSWGETHPETGKADEVGAGPGVGYNLNIPLPLGTGDKGYEYAFDELVLPEIEAFVPDCLIIACGQDASQFDFKGRQSVTMDGFRRLGQRARAIADKYCDGQLLLVQEGGYSISYAPYCLHATLEGVLGLESLLPDPLAYWPEEPKFAIEAVNAIRDERALAIEAATQKPA